MPAPAKNAASADDDAAFLRSYDATRYALPSVTVDVCALTVLDSELKVLATQRERAPFEGRWALPGTFVRVAPPKSHPSAKSFQGDDERLEDAAQRALRTKAQMPDGTTTLRQLMTIGPIDRDPRTRVVTVVYMGLVAPELSAFWRTLELRAPLKWLSVAALDDDDNTPALSLAFDHGAIIRQARLRLQRELQRGPQLAFDLAPQTFSVAELRNVFAAVAGSRLDPANFRRRFLAWEKEGWIEVAEGQRVTGRRRAAVYKRASTGA